MLLNWKFNTPQNNIYSYYTIMQYGIFCAIILLILLCYNVHAFNVTERLSRSCRNAGMSQDLWFANQWKAYHLTSCAVHACSFRTLQRWLSGLVHLRCFQWVLVEPSD